MKTISLIRSLGIGLVLASLFIAALVIPPSPSSAQASSSRGATGRKIIALTFDDGPKPYVLMGAKLQSGATSPSLLDLLDREGVKATFFVMGFRLADTANEFCRQTDVGINCRQAAEEEHRRGHEIENHTYGHGPFSKMAKRYGENWVLNDIDRASRIIESVTGVRPQYVRPPDWDVWEALREKIEARGYHLMTKSKGDVSEAPAIEDVDSQDYIYAKLKSALAAAKTEHDYVVQRIEQRERKGVSTHILVFHELPISVGVLSTLIPELRKRGYEFVTLRDYMKTVVPARNWSHLDRTHTSNRRESVQSHHPRPLLTRRGV